MAKEKKKKEKKAGWVKVVGEGFEGFVDWGEPTASRLTKEKKGDMSSLTVGLAAQKRKRAAKAHNETALSSEGPGDKRPRQFSPKEEA